jgi:hypothetical protein
MFSLTIRLNVNHLVACLILEIVVKVIVEKWM